MAQHQIDAANSPIITALTTQSALQNSAQIDKSMTSGVAAPTASTASMQ